MTKTIKINKSKDTKKSKSATISKPKLDKFGREIKELPRTAADAICIRKVKSRF